MEIDQTKMKKINDNFFKHSLFIFIASLIMNATGYFFHFFIGRTLGPASYGVLGTLLTILYIINVPFNTIQTTMSKFIAQIRSHEKQNSINHLLRSTLKKIFGLSLGVFILYIFFSKFIADFLKIDQLAPVILMGTLVIFALLLSITWGVLQGLQKFKSLGSSMIFQGIVKLSLGLLLVFLGLGVNGAIIAIVLAFFLPFLITLYTLKKYLVKGEKVYNSVEIFHYSIPVLIAMLSITLLFSLDIFLVKHFFSDIEAGYYAALAMLGKVIYFGSISIVYVMFPKVVELNEKNLPSRNILVKSLLIVATFCGLATLFYFIFPKFTISLLFGNDFLSIAPLLGKFAIFMSVLALVYVLIFYNLSLHKKSFIFLLVSFNILEIILFVFFHKSIAQVVYILLGLSLSLFLFLIIYTFSRMKNGSLNSNTSL